MRTSGSRSINHEMLLYRIYVNITITIYYQYYIIYFMNVGRPLQRAVSGDGCGFDGAGR